MDFNRQDVIRARVNRLVTEAVIRRAYEHLLSLQRRLDLSDKPGERKPYERPADRDKAA